MRLVLAFAFMFGFSLPLAPVEASEWGCEILLCAAAENPSWQGVQSCHPPMERLISAMKRPGFSWPTCPEGGAGKTGYQKYADCPAGWIPSAGQRDFDRGRGRELSRCSRVVDRCSGRNFRPRYGSDNNRVVIDGNIPRVYSGNNSCRYIEFSARPLRDKPYYFDIKDDNSGKETRRFFDLRK
ncbi:hypothetical protein C9413_26210 [Rhizobium sp. SEMIA 4085]|uniref:hypothetical protein n=1 Tax=Rhizobium sp. SEMIA 4085 TaxID=2137761 RepID=UPI001478FFA2|nr:hypothetical protein [Rhizobium sp. SEMIA 4085]NNH32809.1 hypothetical protein [Rhizobium sp. SEMIA 4085]